MKKDNRDIVMDAYNKKLFVGVIIFIIFMICNVIIGLVFSGWLFLIFYIILLFWFYFHCDKLEKDYQKKKSEKINMYSRYWIFEWDKIKFRTNLYCGILNIPSDIRENKIMVLGTCVSLFLFYLAMVEKNYVYFLLVPFIQILSAIANSRSYAFDRF